MAGGVRVRTFPDPTQTKLSWHTTMRSDVCINTQQQRQDASRLGGAKTSHKLYFVGRSNTTKTHFAQEESLEQSTWS